MVNTEMFKGAFQFGNKPVAQPQPQPQPQYIPNPNYVAPAPQPVAPAPVPVAPAPVAPRPPQQPEDPEIAKMRAWLLKALVILVGGSAILLIIWRIALKFL